MKFYLFISISLFLLFSQFFPFVYSIIDNGILGEPYVDCGGNYIELRFDTRNTFRGIVFVEDHLNDPQCRSSPTIDDETNGKEIGQRNAQIKLNFFSCGINFTKYDNPKGVFLSAKIVLAFHPQYLSKIDRLYELKCFYMEMEHQLENELIIQMGPPIMHTKQVPMPVCRYEVLAGGPQGPPVLFATIGQMHSCIVDDGHGDRVELIDEQGCAKDKHLLQNLDYISDLMVGKEAHVYKYADRESMFFDCKITLSIKEPGTQFCPVPECPDPPRKRRHLNYLNNSFNEKENNYFILKNKERENIEEICENSNIFIYSTLIPLDLALIIIAILLIRDGFKQF
uniref:ZP domain-containing protein n=1 Tax=Meloidogyne hapla TaxID=6305 RepID=A0A1I8BC36_MELHA